MTAPTLNADPVREELEKILLSPGFARSERMGHFLRFVVEQQLQGAAAQLKETTIGVAVFGRRPDFDPKLDSIVRTEAARLRKRLHGYYATAGAQDPIVIELPKGGYAPVFHSRHEQDRAPRLTWKKAGLGAVLLTLLAGAALLLAPRKTPPVIAVLPLQNLSTEPDNEFFTDGLTDELIRSLAAIEGLEVRSRTSSFALKNKPRNVREVGKQLGADYLLEGSVLRSGSRLRLNIQLVRVSDDTPLWSDRMDRDLADIFAIQDEISLSVVNQLRLKLGRGKRRYHTNPAIYDLYLRARAILAPGSPTAVSQSIELFEKVIAQDPNFAPAWAGLASAHGAGLFNAAGVGLGEIRSRMRTAAEKAIQIDPLLAEAHHAMGAAYCHEWSWAAAERSFRRAIELDPSWADAYVDLAWCVLCPVGKLDAALQELGHAAKVDPLSLDVARTRAAVLVDAGRPDEAIQTARRILAVDPEFYGTQRILARALVRQARFPEAIAILEKLGSWNDVLIAYIYASTGRHAEAEALASKHSGNPAHLAGIYAGFRDKERTFGALDRMFADHDPMLPHVLVFPEFAFLRGDPRYQGLRRKLGLPDYTRTD